MAVYFAPKEENFGNQLGTSLGTGLGEGLKNIIGMKLQQMAQGKQASAFQGLGFSPEQSQALSGLPQELQIPVIKQLFQTQGQSALENYLQGGLPQTSSGMQALQQPQQQDVSQMLGQQGVYPQIQEAYAALQDKLAPKQAVQQPTEAKPLSYAERVRSIPKGLNPAQRREAMEFAKQQVKEERELQKTRSAERNISLQEQKAADKDTKAYFDQTNKEGKAAKQNLSRLDKMEKLIDKGSLPNPFLASALKTLKHGIGGLGIDLTALLGADAEEFEKISQDFLKDAKSIFGSRLTDFDVKSFLSTVPNLVQSDAGKKRLINNLRELNEGSIILQNATNQIIRENKGKRPADLEILAQERAKPQLDLLADEFKKSAEQIAQFGTLPEKLKRSRKNIGLSF